MTTGLWVNIVATTVAALAVLCSLLFWSRIRKGERVSAIAQWGGLGGGTGGWQLTTALVALLGALFLWALAGALAIYASYVQRSDEVAQINRQREDAKTALDERHRAEERADREAERMRAERAAPSASVVPAVNKSPQGER